MAYGVTPEGFVSKTFAEIRQEIDDHQKQHISAGLDLSDNSPDGLINASHALQLAKLWEAAQAIVANFDPDQSIDWALLQLGKLTGTTQTPYTKTLVIATVTMDPNQALPIGSVANLTDKPNIRFLSTVEVPADPTGGSFDVVFEAENAGVQTVDIGELDEISIAVTGWLSVNNAAVEYYTGTEPEDDAAFRLKRERELASSGSATLDAVISGVSQVTGVINVTGRENPSAMPFDTMPPHYMHLVVRGGTDADVAQAIFDERAGGGAGTVGDTSVTVTDSQNQPQVINFDRPTPLTFYAAVSVTTKDGWDGADGLAEIKTNIKSYVESLGNGHDVIHAFVESAVTDVAGVYDITSVLISFDPAPSSTNNLVVGRTEYPTSDVLDISVSATPHVGDL